MGCVLITGCSASATRRNIRLAIFSRRINQHPPPIGAAWLWGFSMHSPMRTSPWRERKGKGTRRSPHAISNSTSYDVYDHRRKSVRQVRGSDAGQASFSMKCLPSNAGDAEEKKEQVQGTDGAQCRHTHGICFICSLLFARVYVHVHGSVWGSTSPRDWPLAGLAESGHRCNSAPLCERVRDIQRYRKG